MSMIRHGAVIVGLCVAAVAQARPLAMVKPDQPLVQQAEEYSRRNTRARHSWEKVRGKRKDIPDHLHALPMDNTVFEINNKDFEKKSPVVEYDLAFESAGSYYVWVRGKGEPGGASITVGMDDKLARSAIIAWFPYKFAWRGTYLDDARITLQVAEPGDHTIQFWMIEDGFCFDQFAITTDPNYQPPKGE